MKDYIIEERRNGRWMDFTRRMAQEDAEQMLADIRKDPQAGKRLRITKIAPPHICPRCGAETHLSCDD